LLLNYTYGEKGQKHFERLSRRMTLTPPVRELIFHGESTDNDEVFRATGLDEFAKTGMGKIFCCHFEKNRSRAIRYLYSAI
jgi:hypothetical protein